MCKIQLICSCLVLYSFSLSNTNIASDIQNQSPLSIDTVFVSASRIENNIFLLPISSLLITKSDINNKSSGDIASLLINEQGIDVRNYRLLNGASSISLLGSTSQQTLVLLDGLPINSASSGMPDLGLFSINNLERIEIVKGPTSSLYGANALGGVVNLITQSALQIKDSLIYDIDYKYGSYQTSLFNFTTGIKPINTILNYHQTKTNGIRTNDDLFFEGINLSSGYLFNAMNRIHFGLNIASKEIGLPGPLPDTSQHPLYGDATSFSKYDHQKDMLYLVKSSANFSIKPKCNLALASHYLINNSNFLWVNQWSLDTSLYHEQYNTKTFIVNLVNRYQYSSSGVIAIGTDFEHNQFYGLTQYPSDTSWSPTIRKFGVFAEGSVRYLNKLNTFTSIRYDNNSGFGNFISPSMGISSNHLSNLKIRIHIGRAYRAPTMNDLYWPLSGNLSIKPEVGTAMQIGLDYTPNSTFFLSATGFTRRTENLINWLPDTANIWRPANIDSSIITGLELQIKTAFIANLQTNLSGTWQNATQIKKEINFYDSLTQTTGFEYVKRKQAYLPELTLSLSINYQLKPYTNFILSGNYTSERFNYYTDYSSLPDISMQTKTLPAHFTISMQITHQIMKHLKLSLKTDNLLNGNYAEQFGNSIFDRDYPRPGRTIFIGINIAN